MVGTSKVVVRIWALACCVALVVCTGCQDGDSSDVSSMNKLNIQKVRNVYQIYSSRNRFRGPKSEEELKKYLRGDKTAQIYLGRMGVEMEELDDIFVSERDGEPFVVRWGINGEDDHPIVFEKTGEGGSRMVSFFTPKEVTDVSEYDRYLNGEYTPESAAEALKKAEQAAAESPGGS